jgi:hypothetical protein
MAELTDEDRVNICNAYLAALVALIDNPTAENLAAADEAGKEWDKIG